MMTTTAHPYLCDRVDHIASARPDSIALTYGDVEMSYAQLARQSADLADEIAGHALSATGPAVVALPRGPEQIVTMLALWRAGLSYLPADHLDPLQRHHEIQQATGAVATISQQPRPSSGLSKVTITAHTTAKFHPSPGSLQPESPNPAYVIFTSGSTGHPKGVAASHEALSSLLEQLVTRYGITPEDRVLQFAAPTFDTSIEQIGVALAAGAALVLPAATSASSMARCAPGQRWAPRPKARC